MVFGFWLIENIYSDESLSLEKQEAFNKLLLFSSVNDQISFFKNFIEEFKPTQKLMKSTIRAHNKKPKQKKFVEKNKDLENENKPKRGRAKKVKPVVSDEQQVLIDNLVSAANGSSETVIDSIPNPDTLLS